MASITDYVIKLQELTKKNLDILQAINDSFFTKQNHLSVKIGDNQYAIPSFISLENKINLLMSNFENLVNSPKHGEAFFNFDGNSRSIEVKSYNVSPRSIELLNVENFNSQTNNIFKDFMTPSPYISLKMNELPKDITQVLVKKIIPINSELISFFQNELNESASINCRYSSIYEKLYNFEVDKDYIEYDTKVDMPINKCIGTGSYVIEKIISDEIDENLDNYITIKFRNSYLPDNVNYMNKLSYVLFDGTIEKKLQVGDHLITSEGNAKMEIISLDYSSNIVTVKVLHGDFLNLVESDPLDVNISSLSVIDFLSTNLDDDRYIKIPLEEDQFIFVAVSPLNSKMNLQAPWGSGLILNTYKLVHENNSSITFKKYYDENVRNVGDVLFEITSMMSNTITNHSEDQYNEIVKYIPVISENNLLVTQINKHLNDSISVQNIRSLYSQKKEYMVRMDEIQKEIEQINQVLSTISFNDTTGLRTTYMAQLEDLINKKNDLDTSISKILNEISIAANNSETPIENAKYRIRGFFDCSSIENDYLKSHVKGIKVQYRYKNADKSQGQAMSINDKFIFSEWNDMQSFDKERISKLENGIYKFSLQDDNDNTNEPSFNQIDIPISQGETVDIRLKLIYDFGAPFVYTTSDWSQIINIKFPSEYLKDVQILDIIAENNSDIESNRFKNIIKKDGIPEHIEDKIVDQDIIYYHKPENIASGFFTAERRIIPLKDKLSSLDNLLTELKDEIYGTNTNSLKVSIKQGDISNELQAYQTTNISLEPYSSLISSSGSIPGNYDISDDGIATTVLNISLINESNHIAKLYSLFPGNRDNDIYNLINYKFKKEDYIGDGTEKGVWLEFPGDKETSNILQGGNQYLYFRVRDVNTGTPYYGDDNVDDGENKLLSWKKDGYKYENGNNKSATLMYMYPKLNNKYNLCIESDSIGSYITLAPNSEIIIPIIVQYKVAENSETYKTMSFDILPSLYKDPITYTFKVNAKYNDTIQDRIISSIKKRYKDTINSDIVKYNTSFK